MKIVDVCAFYTPAGGGVKTYVDRKLIAARDMGHEIVVIAPGRTNAVVERGPGATLVTVASPTSLGETAAARARISPACASRTPSLPHAIGVWSGWSVSMACE